MTVYRMAQIISKCVAAFLVLGAVWGCTARHLDTWEIKYDTDAQNIGITHLLVKSQGKVLDEEYFKNPDGSLVKFYREGFVSEMPHPDSVFVQWVDNNTGISSERDINLKGLLPESLEGQNLTLVFTSEDVYIFLVHSDLPAYGVKMIELPSPQIFPDPSVKPYVGANHPKNFVLPQK